MRSDTKALVKIFGWSSAFALLFMGVAAAAGVGWLTFEAAAYLVLGCGVVFLFITRKYGPALHQQQPRKDRPAELDAAPDRGGTK